MSFNNRKLCYLFHYWHNSLILIDVKNPEYTSMKKHFLHRKAGYLLLLFGLIHTCAYAQLAFPEAEGYGAKTRGAYSGSATPKILIVDNLDPGDFGDEATGRGTFRWCINRPYPRIVLFEVGGVIDYRTLDFSTFKYISITNPYLTVAGQTAPGPGITIIGTMVVLKTHDVIMQHIRIRHGDDLNGIDGSSRDCLSIYSDAKNVIIDHCSFSWGIDEIIGMTQPENLTMSNCIFSEPLDQSLHYNEYGDHEPEDHGYAMLIDQANNITLKNNLYAYSMDRHPLTRANNIVIMNNMMYNSNLRIGPNFQSGKVNIAYVGNVALPAPDASTSSLTKLAGLIMADIHPDAKIYASDNMCVKSLENPNIKERDKFYFGNPDFQLANTSPVPLEGYSILNASNVEDYVLSNVGTKPFKRDEIDQRIVENVRNRTGHAINSPAPLPARAYNFSRTVTGTSAGYMLNGYDWQANPKSFSLNGKTIQLNQKCTSIHEVLDLINPQLPAGVETFICPGNTYIGFRTLNIGPSQSLSINGAYSIFGIPDGTYYGEEGVGWPAYATETRPLTSIDSYPEENPHDDNTGDGFTNLQEWLYAMGLGSPELLPSEAKPAGPEIVCQGSQDIQYTTVGSENANTYTWQVTPDDAGTVTSDGKTAIIDWEPDFYGSCALSYNAYGPIGFAAISPPLNIHVDPLPKAPVTPEGPVSLYQNSPDKEYSLHETFSDVISYEWDLFPANAGTITNLGDRCRITWNESFFGNCYLSVRGINECGAGMFSDSLVIQVSEMELGYGIINIFTPNGDGFNDYWSLPFIREYPEAIIKIYDRNNRLLIEYRGTDSSWNGTVNGELVPMGNYLYVIDLGQGRKPIKGYVTVLR